MNFALPPSTQDRFAAIVRALCAALFIRHAAGPTSLPHPLFVALHNFISLRSRRFQSLVARVRAGTLRTRLSRPRPPSAARQRPPTPYLSRRRGWLLILMQPAAAAAHGHLSHLLAQPDMAELIARAPTLGRILRPLAHMLAMELPPALQRPPRSRPIQPRPIRPKRTRSRPLPPKPDHSLPSRRPSIVVRGSRLPRIVFGPG